MLRWLRWLRRRKTGQNGERGQVLVWAVILLPLLLALVGLVFDGGMLWVQYRKARWAINGAAVSAATLVDVPHYIETGQVVLGENALDIADYYARRNYPALHVRDVYVDNVDNVVYVEGWFRTRTTFLSMFGVSGFRVNVRGKERPAWGISEEGQ